jgi:hypothetical protein
MAAKVAARIRARRFVVLSLAFTLALATSAGVASGAAAKKVALQGATIQKLAMPSPGVKPAGGILIPDTLLSTRPPQSRDTTNCRPQRTILPNGAVKTTFPDGSYTLAFRCGEERYGPDGKLRMRTSCAEVASDMPPAPPLGSVLADWLRMHADGLLGEIRMILDDQPADVVTYLAYEKGQAADVYQRIDLRTRLIAKLLAP